MATAPSSWTQSSPGRSWAPRSRPEPADIYRSLLEATVFGTRVIIDAMETAGVPIEGIVACGGLPFQNRLLMQLTADITGRTVRVSASRQAPALGAAMFGAVAAGAAAGGYETITDAAAHMAHLGPDVYRPAVVDRVAWDEGYAIYRELHDSMSARIRPCAECGRLQHRARRGAIPTETTTGGLA